MCFLYILHFKSYKINMSRGLYPHTDYSRSFIKKIYYEIIELNSELPYYETYNMVRKRLRNGTTIFKLKEKYETDTTEKIKSLLLLIKDEYMKLCDTSVEYCLKKLIEWKHSYPEKYEPWENRKMYDIYYAYKFKNKYENFNDCQSAMSDLEIIRSCINVIKEYLELNIIKKDLEDFENEYKPKHYKYGKKISSLI